MLDQTIENIIQRIRKEVVQPGMDNIPLTYLLTRNIPNSVKHFFDQEVEIWLREEAEKFSSSERFDYDTPEVRVLIDKIFDILKQTANFHINQFNLLLERAIKLEAHYLLRPHQTLTQFLFKDSFVITTMEVYDMLKYFDKFQYYKDALTDYFNLKYLREISQTQFEELIAGIDNQVFANEPVDTALKTIKTIIQFLNEGREPTSDTVSTEIVLTAFKDRRLHDYASLIEQEKQEGTEELHFTDLEQILRSGKTLREIKAKPAAEVVSLEEVEDIEKARPEVAVEDISVSEEVAVPEAEVEELVEEEAPIESLVPGAAAQLADVLTEKMKGEIIEDVTSLISPKQKKKFIKKIFKKSEQRYQQFIELVNKSPSWKNASYLIDEYFMQTGINPYSKEALEFSDLIYNRYFPKDIGIEREEFD